MKPISAVLWSGNTRLPGQLQLSRNCLVFRFDELSDSSLKWELPLDQIASVNTCLVFGLARNGLEIRSKSGKQDLFVVDDPEMVKKNLLLQIRAHSS